MRFVRALPQERDGVRAWAQDTGSGGRGEQVERAGGASLLEAGCEGGLERKEWRQMQEETAVAFCCCFCLLFVCFKTHRILIGLGTMPIRREEHFGKKE